MSSGNFKNWTALFSSNFLGVFNDNLLKNGIIFFAIKWSLPSWITDSQLITLASAALIFPYLFLSPLAGNITTRISKIRIFRFFKLIELPIMLIAAFAFWQKNVYIALLSVTLMGIQSCLYSPAKYSLIRDIGGEHKVAFGSGVFETMSFLAILCGTIVASWISDYADTGLLSSLFIIVAIAGYIVTRLIRVNELPLLHEHANLNPINFLMQAYKLAANYPNVNKSIVGSSIFWLVGGMLQMNIIIHTQHVYNASNTQTGIIMAVAAIAIALGCTAAAKIAGKGTGRFLIFPGLLTMMLALTLLSLTKPSYNIFVLLIFIVAFAGGFLQVPNMATIQKSNSGRKLGDLIAYLNLTTFIFILIGTLLFSLTAYLTHDNSFAVFGVILFISFATFLFFALNSNKKTHS